MAPNCEIEYDVNKRNVTLENRGLDFEDAPSVFADHVYSRLDEREEYGEERIITVGRLRNRTVVMVWTWRGRKRRIISMRYANDREKRWYAECLGRS